jgi:tRNA-2-methylthio-N6-dimethylallyladenosine synthase
LIRNSDLEIENSFTKNKFFVKVFGCQYNEFDATVLANELKSHGLIESNLDEADFVFVLNCSVRKTGVDRALGFTRNLIDKSKKVFLSGCIIEPDKKRFLKKNVKLFDLSDLSFLSNLSSNHKTSQLLTTSKFIPIMKGCNNFCSYCVVPYTRGREMSRPLDDIINDAKKIISSGQKEIWLLGQNVNSYNSPPLRGGVGGGDNNDTIEQSFAKVTDGRQSSNEKYCDFTNLLHSLNGLQGDFTIYFTSNHPKDMSDEIINAVATLPKVAKQIHLPLQSGSDKVLRSMNRPYTVSQYLKLVDKIKKSIPNVKITTDVIVGYPTETEDDFKKTVEVFMKVKYFQAYVNKYSPRENTAAHKLGDPVPWSEKQRRWSILNEIVNIKI